ncbi:cryptochrome/photolyase family protein [Segetibacter aerophilus]|uniref:Cryptochrome/photolyase family protein n=1 Tax=Segetibacter aerophilus TaxID=670293 RepID=A0A512B6G1_9BACT|nr:cryptochrome/photolyase family protein [Segetibacter aerophilus]GEO07560.1 cryptochrome/photolyase family protein [Segetibacter aerophilus]
MLSTFRAHAVTLIFPHQLFRQHPAVSAGRSVILIEELLYFNQYNFIKQKLVLHRASMKFYQSYLEQKHTVNYIEATDENCDVRKLIPALAKVGVTEIHYVEVSDYLLERRISKAAQKYGIKVIKYQSPNFLSTLSDVDDYFNEKNRYFMTDFYKWQRKLRGILMEGGNQPVGGKWSFDEDNRQKIPKGTSIPRVTFPAENKFVTEAKDYVTKNYSTNYGSTTVQANVQKGFFPVTFEEAEQWLEQFFEERFMHFGVYEDAMVSKENFLFHGTLTPMLNIGLLNPHQIIDRALETAAKHTIPINSLEGFIRQIMGWREYIHIVYMREGSKQRTKNYWGFTRKIPISFWKGTTGIVPVDTVIQKILNVGYCHHIERLMVMGNFMLLCEFDPDDVYKWFMEMFVDAYDWVMVPNTYGMTQFSDGGIMMTKPYISSSNYIMKMSDYKKGDWQLTWDALFWRFMHVHRDVMGANKRLSMLLRTYDNMPKEKQHLLMKTANDFLQQLEEVYEKAV